MCIKINVFFHILEIVLFFVPSKLIRYVYVGRAGPKKYLWREECSTKYFIENTNKQKKKKVWIFVWMIFCFLFLPTDFQISCAGLVCGDYIYFFLPNLKQIICTTDYYDCYNILTCPLYIIDILLNIISLI